MLGGGTDTFSQNNKTMTKNQNFEKSNKICPVMIKWINDAQAAMDGIDGETLIMDECEMGQLIICGRILEVDAQPGKTLITIDDTTGKLTVQINKRYDQAEPKILQGIDLEANKYLTVVLNVTKYKDQFVNMAINLSNVVAGDKITEHICRSILCQKHRKFGPLRDEETENMQPSNNNVVAQKKFNGTSGMQTEKTIEGFLRANGAQSVNNIANFMGINFADCQQRMQDLMDQGEVYEDSDGIYAMS